MSTGTEFKNINLYRSFVTVIVLCTLVTLLIKLICILLKGKYIQTKIMLFLPIFCESEAVQVFKIFLSRSPGFSVHMGKFSSRSLRSR